MTWMAVVALPSSPVVVGVVFPPPLSSLPQAAAKATNVATPSAAHRVLVKLLTSHLLQVVPTVAFWAAQPTR